MDESVSKVKIPIVVGLATLLAIVLLFVWLRKPQKSEQPPSDRGTTASTEAAASAVTPPRNSDVRRNTSDPAPAKRTDSSTPPSPAPMSESPDETAASDRPDIAKTPAPSQKSDLPNEKPAAAGAPGESRSPNLKAPPKTNPKPAPDLSVATSQEDALSQEIDAASALKTAASWRAKAEQSASRGRHAQAFQEALKAWESVRGAAAVNAECRKAEIELRALLKNYGEAANASARAGDLTKPLILRSDN